MPLIRNLKRNTNKEELSKTQKATEPLSLETSFKSYDETYLYNYSTSNIVGDTLYTNGCSLENCILVNNESKSVANCNSLPKGYYYVSSIFMCQDSGSKELADNIFEYIDKGYSLHLKIGSYAISDKSQFYEAISKNGQWLGGSMSQQEVNAKLQLNRQQNKAISFNDRGVRLKIIYRLCNTDSSNIYFTAIPAWVEDRFLPVSYFNFISKELKGKNVLMTYSGNKNDGTGFYRSSGTRREIKDVLTNQVVYQRDTLFRCVDVVADAKEDGSEMKVCCVFEGKNTGKIALNVVRLIESKDEDKYDDPNLLNYYKSSNGEWTIWQESASQKKEGMLFRGRHFDAAYPLSGNNIMGDSYRRIIKVDDLKNIFEDTKKNLANAADHQKQVAARYNAWKTYKLYNLSHKYGERYGSLIIDHKVDIGMTQKMCKEAWGSPIRIITGSNELGNFVEWIYNYNRYIFFVNNKVVEILY